MENAALTGAAFFMRKFRLYDAHHQLLVTYPTNGRYSYADCLTWRFTDYVELMKGRILRKISTPTLQHQEVASNF